MSHFYLTPYSHVISIFLKIWLSELDISFQMWTDQHVWNIAFLFIYFHVSYCSLVLWYSLSNPLIVIVIYWIYDQVNSSSFFTKADFKDGFMENILIKIKISFIPKKVPYILKRGLVKNLFAMCETWAWYWPGKFPAEGNGNPLQCSCLEMPWTWEPGQLQSMGLLKVGYNFSD